MATSHFYWVWAITAMVFLGVFMMPFYYGSRARSAPASMTLRFAAPRATAPRRRRSWAIR